MYMKNLKKTVATIVLITAVTISFSYKSDFFEIAKQIEIYTTLFKELNLYYIDEINPADVMDKAIKNTLKDLDPYTRFYDEQGVEKARISAEGEYGGIGASISFKDGNLIVKEVFKDYPAHTSGLLPGDEIIKIDNIVLKSLEEEYVRLLVKGLPSTKLNVEIKRQNELKKIELVRETIELNAVPFYAMVDDEVGYISFVKFNRKASQEVKNAFLDLKAQGMKKLIIDVRHNPGGLLGEAVNTVNLFIPKNKVVVTTRAKLDKWSNTYKTKNPPIDINIPLVIIVDNRSASASEILAGALQDYDRAVIIGQRSFGKGLVQRSRKLSYGTQLKLTISKYYTPSGRCIQELDYTNRNSETGKVPKFSEGKVNEFKTVNGRAVFDGGGVTPDLFVEKIKKTPAAEKLLNSDVIFNFVTEFYHKNPSIEDPKIFRLPSKKYDDFKKYAEIHADEFKLNTELSIDKSMEIAEKENLKLTKEYINLSKKIRSEKINSLDLNKKEILKELENRIIKRYYFKEGTYLHKMSFDEEIKKGLEILKNENKYIEILN